MELVTKPVIHSSTDAGNFARELQLLLRSVEVGEANMEKGQMRVEANISVAKTDLQNKSVLGTKVEVKNLNSFRSVERAIEFEVARQTEILKKGGVVEQETLGWDEVKEKTFTQRKKESSHDYRYFTDPDITKFILSDIPDFSSKGIRDTLPELPWDRRARYKELGLKGEDAEMLIRERAFSIFFEQVEAHLKENKQLKKN